jgi:hypothetical protein
MIHQYYNIHFNLLHARILYEYAYSKKTKDDSNFNYIFWDL